MFDNFNCSFSCIQHYQLKFTFQEPDEHSHAEDNPTVDVDAVLNFVGSNLIGGQFESSNDSMSYFCGYLLKKLITYHLQHTKSDFSTCECCSNALSSQDLSFHLFVSFKEYKDHENSS